MGFYYMLIPLIIFFVVFNHGDVATTEAGDEHNAEFRRSPANAVYRTIVFIHSVGVNELAFFFGPNFDAFVVTA